MNVTGLLERFARVVIRKLRELVCDYVLIRVDESMESMVQALSRTALAWSLERFIKAISAFPLLHPTVTEAAATDLRHLADRLWRPIPWRTT